MTLHPLRDLNDAETMRIIRNTCREWMTNDQHEITPEEQQQWWSTFDRAIVRPFLYWADDVTGNAWIGAPGIIGYGLVRFIHGRWWLSGGIMAGRRGAGEGKRLFMELAAYVHSLGHDASLTVFEDNDRARRCYQAIGFTEEAAAVDGAAGSKPLIYMVKELP